MPKRRSRRRGNVAPDANIATFKSKNRDSFYFVILSYEKAGSAAITESVPPLGILQLEEP
jgi:hypothetical protein